MHNIAKLDTIFKYHNSIIKTSQVYEGQSSG